MTRPWGEFSCALGAGPLSPENPGRPLPAMRIAFPLESRRKTEFSAVKYTFPEGSRATLPGCPSAALVSAAGVGAGEPPATVEITYCCAHKVLNGRQTTNPARNLILILMCRFDVTICTRVPL